MYHIIYEDDYLIGVNKPSGLLTIPTPKNETHTLTNLINPELMRRGLSIKAHPCHRLDRETSGIILYAKGKKMQQQLMELFHTHHVRKLYIAFIRGVPAKKEATINMNIEGKPATTQYKVIQVKQDYSIVEIVPLTGRTNQIRIHFKKIGHPLLGETKYAFRRDFTVKFRRVALHAKELEFIHPITKQKIMLTAPLADDMQRLLSGS